MTARADWGAETPSSAGIWNYWAGGDDHQADDREAGDAAAEVCSAVWDMAEAGRQFLGRAVHHLAGQGISQFLDVGCGLRPGEALHDIARRTIPDARVVYVDNDPLAVERTRQRLDGAVSGDTAAALTADLRAPATLLEQAGALLDLDRPVGVLMGDVLPHLAEDEQARSAVRRLMGRLPAGSHLAVTHPTGDLTPSLVDALQVLHRQDGPALRARTRDEVTALAYGLDLVAPGVVNTARWRPRPAPHVEPDVPQYALLARKP